MSDNDGDGIPDDIDTDDDGDGIPDDQELDSDRNSLTGQEVVRFGGEDLTQKQDIFGNPVLTDADGHVIATVEPDGDIHMEGGTTYTQTDPSIGWGQYRGADGTLITVQDDITGITDYKTSGDDREGDGGDSSPEGWTGDPGSWREGEGADGSADGEGHPSRPAQDRPARRSNDTERKLPQRRRERKQGFGCLFALLFCVYEPAVILGVTWIFWTQHFQWGWPRAEAVAGVWLIVVIFYILTALLWLMTGRLFLIVKLSQADCLTWVMSTVMILTPLVTAIAMNWA